MPFHDIDMYTLYQLLMEHFVICHRLGIVLATPSENN